MESLKRPEFIAVAKRLRLRLRGYNCLRKFEFINPIFKWVRGPSHAAWSDDSAISLTLILRENAGLKL